MKEMNIAEALNSALLNEMERDPEVVLIGEDVGKDGGVFRISEGLLDRFGADRVMDAPIAESGFTAFGIGMALRGMKPVIEIQFMGFLWPALDQLSNHASRFRNRTQGRWHVPMVVRTPYGGGFRALEHHAESFESVLVHIPGLKVVIPSTPYDAKGLLISSIRDPDPVVFMESIRLYRLFRQPVPEETYEVPLGKANIVREGSDLTLVGWGSMMPKLLKVADLVSKKGVSLEVIDLRTLSPYDERTVNGSVKKTGRIVVVQEAPRTLGFASEIITRVSEDLLDSLEAPPVRVTGFDVPFPFYKMEKWAMPDVDRIMKGVREALTW